jgi:hypothetical protein
MSKEIKIGFCAAYDWYLLKQSLPLVYKDADQILVAIDKDRMSWAGKKYTIDEGAFASFIQEIDTDRKIKLYEDDFHLPELRPMENEVRQRNLMAAQLGNGGWHIQLDTDEYFVDFPGFVAYLKENSFSRSVNINCPFVVLFKTVEGGFLTINAELPETVDFFPIATNDPKYEYGRRNGHFNVKANFSIVHQTWAREEAEVEQKIQNWGHKEDFDVAAYFEHWKTLNGHNFQEFINFHPIVPSNWPSLTKVNGNSIAELIEYFRRNPPFTLTPAYLRKQNSIWRSRFNSLLKKFV